MREEELLVIWWLDKNIVEGSEFPVGVVALINKSRRTTQVGETDDDDRLDKRPNADRRGGGIGASHTPRKLLKREVRPIITRQSHRDLDHVRERSWIPADTSIRRAEFPERSEILGRQVKRELRTFVNPDECCERGIRVLQRLIWVEEPRIHFAVRRQLVQIREWYQFALGPPQSALSQHFDAGPVDAPYVEGTLKRY